MKQVLFIMLLPVFAQAQDFTKQYITQAGDTITANNSLKIAEGKGIDFIYPNYYDAGTNSTNAAALERRKRYLKMNMAGNTYPIKRLSRIRIKKGEYKEIAVLSVYDKELRLFDPVEYIVEIENALKNDEIQIVK